MGTISIKTENTVVVIKGTAKKRTDGVDTVMDLSVFADRVDLIFKGPDRSTQTIQAAITDSANGLFNVTTSTAIFSGVRGSWSVQAKYTLVGGGAIYSDVQKFEVGETLGA